MLQSDRCDFDLSLPRVNVIEDSELAYSQFPFRQLVGAKLLPVACFLCGLLLELNFSFLDDMPVPILPESAHIVNGSRRESDLKSHELLLAVMGAEQRSGLSS